MKHLISLRDYGNETEQLHRLPNSSSQNNLLKYIYFREIIRSLSAV